MRRIPTVTLAQMDANDPIVMRAARQPGGVSVVDEHGVHRFRLSVPSKPLPIEHCPGCRCKGRK